MSVRAFREYSKGEKAEVPPSKINVIGNRLFVGKKLAITFAPELDGKTKNYLIDINVETGEALEAGEVLYTTRLYDMDELRRFERSANKLKKEMRVKK